ncbi:indolepyruvate ferredoxin oxidoreductase family protein [Aestuariirhabdus litorea]|uniref:Indolepyruvate ferredoxin oxidoreductase family protein n=1 Tax=Aestuariirhabdus litorea TaxID=2528527 RepID=A0A3P3VQW8_9GAMM|nr:indolepyruvate ferredoxin oxidoreductase family protein [Aestuariirhabdus litorea]RRJ85191.1 indolepyruvate ferredoxin oxidoreductase family protein [Aestuariirhabdus litorea]RWW98412.1 indolepyruvate ferredoxin oxidoreductase family protein [Endozoicomonadaceae bacterium GTF-13]
MSQSPVQLDDKYKKTTGRIYISGNQALVRLPTLQHELDKRAGLNTAGFISGYRGSPIGGFDSTLWGAQKLLDAHQISFQPGVNEDLAATAVWGTQLLNAVPDPTVDGVFGIWYGKGPGVDRSGDALKHANYAGTHPYGGVLALYGDDHPGKSSSISHQSEQALAANSIPSLYPADVAEFIEFGLKGWALSRYCGLWVGFKGVNETIEQTATIDIDIDNFAVNLPDKSDVPAEAVNLSTATFVQPIATEVNVTRFRLPLVHRFVRANGIDRQVFPVPANRRLGIVSAGKSYKDVREALQMLNIDSERAAELGLSLYKVGCIWPLEPEGLTEFASGQQELLFIEEKRPFLQSQAAELLYGQEQRPRIVGKQDDQGQTLLPSDVQLEPAQIAMVIAARLMHNGAEVDSLKPLTANLQARAEFVPTMPEVMRTPYFCSGCPHNTSTRVPEGSTAMAGIGCHAMAVLFRPDTLTPCHMGAEGVQWTGLSRYTKTPHIFQNLGDGTYYHSGLVAIRAAVASGANITYKILYNDAVAMTGGQPVDGPISVGEISHQVVHEGIKRCVLVSDNPDQWRNNPSLAPGVEVFHRDRLDHVQKMLREIEGCTVLLYEQTCAAEKRRRRKRGLMPDPSKRLFINPDVCEGCADCSVQSTCVSLQPLPTDRGTKRRIDQSNCNKDYSCNKGFCPSFVTVLGGKPRKPKGAQIDLSRFDNLPMPKPMPIDTSYSVMITGIGGSGVITVGAILGMAAHIEGKACSIYDMTGLSQKNGAVYSHLKLANHPDQLHAQKIGVGESQLVLAFDLAAALAPEAARTISLNQTQVIGNSQVSPTAAFQIDPRLAPDSQRMQQTLRDKAGADKVDCINASGLALSLLGDTIGANLFVVGYALQKGLLPISIEGVIEAVKLNGIAIDFNLLAFNLGRLAAQDPAAIESMIQRPQVIKLPQSLREVRSNDIALLTDYQNAAYAQQYSDLVDRVAEAENRLKPGSERLSLAVARSLSKLMAYKDEYEVARLHSDPKLLERIKAEFEGDYQLRFNLSPPLLAKRHPDTGLPVKREYGSWMLGAFRLLARLKGLRGSALDIFGYTDERRQERRSIEEFRSVVEEMLGTLSEKNFDTAVQLAELPLEIKGFGYVKDRNLEQVKASQEALLKEFREGPKVVQLHDPKAVA